MLKLMRAPDLTVTERPSTGPGSRSWTVYRGEDTVAHVHRWDMLPGDVDGGHIEIIGTIEDVKTLRALADFFERALAGKVPAAHYDGEV